MLIIPLLGASYKLTDDKSETAKGSSCSMPHPFGLGQPRYIEGFPCCWNDLGAFEPTLDSLSAGRRDIQMFSLGYVSQLSEAPALRQPD